MPTSKIRVQTFLNSPTYKALQTFAQENELSLSSAVEKIVILILIGEQQSEYKSEQPSLKALESRLTLLEQQFKAWRDSEQQSEHDSEYEKHLSSEQQGEQQGEYIICYLVDGKIAGYWGKLVDEVKCDWIEEMRFANVYEKEAIAKRELTKLKKKFRNLDIRYNTISKVKLILGNENLKNIG